MHDDLTPRQRQILELIKRHMRAHGYPPTRAEIARTFGFRSVNAAVDHLKALERHGVIELLSGTSRGIRLISPLEELPEDDAELAVIGRVAAGNPILAAEHMEARFTLDPGLFKPRAHYLLRVHGSSMRDAGLLDGDLLAVHRTNEANDGQIVVARIDDEVTVKRLRRDPHHAERVRLLPENPDFNPIVVDLRQQSLVIEGLGVGVLRTTMDGIWRL